MSPKPLGFGRTARREEGTLRNPLSTGVDHNGTHKGTWREKWKLHLQDDTSPEPKRNPATTGGTILENWIYRSLLETDVGESKEDKRARKQMETTVKKVDGHYQMGLPWRYEEPFLPDNRPLAETRLQHLKRRLIKDDGLKQKYTETIQGYLEKGYAQEYPKMNNHKQERGGTFRITLSSTRRSQTRFVWCLTAQQIIEVCH